ncbi:ATP-binding protein [Melissospora conviva]|uniref:ATP-binding protein n=1 Tax=Melissospora conviva TaxID=3388432 RepID=UPI003B7629D4
MAETVERSWCVVVPHDARGARTARHRLAEEFTGLLPPALLADVVTALAELVGNAVRHADALPGGVVRVTWRLLTAEGTRQAEIRVTDGGATGPPLMRTVGHDSVDGRGLRIVTALADRWGVERDGLGQSVWARWRVAPAETRRAGLVPAAGPIPA